MARIFGKIALLLLLLLFSSIRTESATPVDDLPVIPRPKHVVPGNGAFHLRTSDKPVIDAPAEIRVRLSDYLRTCGLVPAVSKKEKSLSHLNLRLKNTLPGVSTPEGYVLCVSGKGITIEATGEAGLFYGIQTLLSLKEDGTEIPFAEITDEPRFGYRGLMLDVSRHFFDKEVIKKQIDAMARLKLNRLHLHLTDAAGWRIEIEKYPLLTDFAAWRDEAIWKKWWVGDRRYANGGGPGTYGGYYTKEDIRDLVRYARARQITIVPEIEMPGHSEEVLTAYPRLSCTHEPYKEADFCAGNEETFRFLEDVLTEVMELFPSEYIHIGGDEAGKASWKECPLCRRRMKEEHLRDTDELQSYFIRRVQEFVEKKGRKIIGWDEITEGGLGHGATVMTWRGTEGSLTAVKQGNNAIMTPGAFCYFDQYQDAPTREPEAIGGYLPLEKVYAFDPVPSGLIPEEAERIKGVQANLWTEYVPTAEHLEYMLYPRLLALAEIAWSPMEQKDYPGFKKRALKALTRLRAAGYSTFDLASEVGNRTKAVSSEPNLATRKPVTYAKPYASQYEAGGMSALTDGRRGGWSYNDGLWQGFIPSGLDVTVDLGKSTAVREIGLDFMQVKNPGVFLPEEVTFYVSEDGKRFKKLTSITHITDESLPVDYKTYSWVSEDREPVITRYVRCEAKPYKKGVWLFTDEIVVR